MLTGALTGAARDGERMSMTGSVGPRIDLVAKVGVSFSCAEDDKNSAWLTKSKAAAEVDTASAATEQINVKCFIDHSLFYTTNFNGFLFEGATTAAPLRYHTSSY
jgi:hypothetical protein